jgi:hypothetical protein
MLCFALSTGLGRRDAAKKLSHNVARRVMAHVVSSEFQELVSDRTFALRFQIETFSPFGSAFRHLASVSSGVSAWSSALSPFVEARKGQVAVQWHWLPIAQIWGGRAARERPAR